MSRQRFDAEDFGRVMTAEYKIDSQLFGCDRSPMRRLTGDKGVNFRFNQAIDFRSGCASDNPDSSRLARAEIKCLNRTAQNSFQFSDQHASRNRSLRFESDRLSFLLQKSLGGFQANSSRKLRVVADFGMHIERQMRAIERDIVFECDLQLAPQRTGDALQSRPEQSVMHNQKIDIFLRRSRQHAG